MDNQAFQDKLREYIKKFAVISSSERKIIVPGGEEGRWLVDIRNVFLKSDALDLIAEIFWNNFENDYPFQVGGQEIAAIPLITAILIKGQQKNKPVNGFIIRKSRKNIGLQKIIEGSLNNDKIILVDDLINSGETILRQLKVLESYGKKADAFFTLLNFQGKKNEEMLAKKGIKLVNIFFLSDFDLELEDENLKSVTEVLKAVWKFESPAQSFYWVIPRSTPHLDEKKLYFGSDDGVFRALNQENGTVSWEFKVGYPTRGKSIFSSPASWKNLVYFGSYDGNVYALDKNNGKKKWKYGEADWVGSSPAISPELGLLFIGLEFGLFKKRGGITALDLETGEKKWEYKMTDYVHSSPAYCRERQLVAIGSNDFYAYLFDARNGRLKWKVKTNGDIKASFAFDLKRNLVLFGSFDEHVYAVDINSGEIRGRYKTRDYIYSTPVVDGDNLYFSSTDKNLYCVNLKNGDLRWRFGAGGRFFASPTVVNNSIYIGATNGILYEINKFSGKIISQFQVTERILNPVKYNPLTKKFFLITHACEIYCLADEKTPSVTQALGV